MANISNEFDRLLREGFQASLETALQESLSGTHWDIRGLQDSKTVHGDEVFMLTLSSHLFRIITTLHFNLDKTMESFLQEAMNKQQGACDDEKRYDYLAEVSNVFCGAFKRELQKAVAALGMSTPNRLNSSCMHYVKVLKQDKQGHYLVNFNGQPLFQASYFLSAYGDLDYTRVIESEPAAEVGELEFF